MPWAVAAAAVAGGASIYASSQASNASADAAAKASKIQQKQYEETRSDLAPYRDTGAAGMEEYAALNGLRGPEAQAAAWARFRSDPGYKFTLDEGNRSIEGSAAARGGTLNGGTLKALQRFGEGQADKQYGSYLERFMHLAGLGENAAAQTGNAGEGAAAREGQYAMDSGNAQAGSYLNMGNQVSGAIGNALDVYQYNRGRTAPPPTYDKVDTGFGQAYVPRS